MKKYQKTKINFKRNSKTKPFNKKKKNPKLSNCVWSWKTYYLAARKDPLGPEGLEPERMCIPKNEKDRIKLERYYYVVEMKVIKNNRWKNGLK